MFILAFDREYIRLGNISLSGESRGSPRPLSHLIDGCSHFAGFYHCLLPGYDRSQSFGFINYSVHLAILCCKAEFGLINKYVHCDDSGFVSSNLYTSQQHTTAFYNHHFVDLLSSGLGHPKHANTATNQAKHDTIYLGYYHSVESK